MNARNLSETAETPQRTQTRTQTHTSSYAHTRQRNRATASMRPGVQVFDKRGEALAALAISPTTAAKKCVAVLVAVALALTMVPLPHTTAATAYADDASPLVAAQPETPFTPAAATGEGIILPGNYKTQDVKIDGVDFIVLKVKEDNSQALLLARDVQHDAPFDEKGSNSWKDSSARKWLNDDWLRDKSELSANVVETTIKTRTNYLSSDPTFIPTQDKVFLLSEPDVYGYEKTRFRVPLQPDDFTVVEDGRGVRLIAEDGPRTASKEGKSRQWWMRSPVYTSNDVSYVCKIGKDLDEVANSTYPDRGFRPALWVRLAEISKDTTPGFIDVTPHTAIVGPNSVVQLKALVKDAKGQRMLDEFQDVSWDVTGKSDLGIHEKTGLHIWNNTKIDQDGWLEVEEREKEGTVLTITATSKKDPSIVGKAQVIVNCTDWPVKTISKTGPDKDNMNVLFLADGFQEKEQDAFIEASTKMWQALLETEPYRSFADKINAYAMCTESIESGVEGRQTFFQSATTDPEHTVTLPSETNHLMDRIIGPAFAKEHMDAGCQESDIDTYVIVANSNKYGGSSTVNRSEINFHYVCITNGREYISTFKHEMGHNLLGLGDEYNGGVMTENNSPNMSRFGDPERVNWRNMLGYNTTYTYTKTPVTYNETLKKEGGTFLASHNCTMNNMTSEFCDVCKLQGVRSMATNVDDQSLYIFKPQLTFGDRYRTPDDFQLDKSWDFPSYRANNEIDNSSFGNLSRSDANKINSLRGKTLSFRTIIQNLSPKEDRNIKISFAITSADGKETRISKEKIFEVGAWTDRDTRYRGKMSVNSSYSYKDGFDSGLANCDLEVQVPANANVQEKDKVVFSITQVNINNTETPLLDQTQDVAQYAKATIHYQDAQGNQLPNTALAVIPVRVGDPIQWQAPARVGNYKYVEGSQTPAGKVTMPAEGIHLYYTYAIDDTPKPDPTPSQTDISGAEVGGLDAVTYDGSEHKLVPTVKLGANTLSPTDDYTVSYSNDLINAGTVKVTIKGKGNYQGTISKSYEIKPAPITLPQARTDLIYSGIQQTGVAAGRGYTITNNIGTNAQSYTALATPEANYCWDDNTTTAKSIPWSIAPKSLTGATITLDSATYTATGAAISPTIRSVTTTDGMAVVASNYTARATNNTEPGTATVTLTGQNNFINSAQTTFTIKGILSTDTATVESLGEINYSDQMTSFINPVVKLKQGTTPLTKGVDFTLEFDNLPTKDPGAGNKVQVSATLRGAGKYLDNTVPDNKLLKVSFTVVGQTNPADPSHDTHTYTGRPIRPGVNLSDANGTPLKEGKDYIIAYSNNVRPGTARMTIVGIGLYCGTIERTFKIVRPARNATPSTVQSVAPESITEAASARSTIDTVALATAAQMTFRPETLYKIG